MKKSFSGSIRYSSKFVYGISPGSFADIHVRIISEMSPKIPLRSLPGTSSQSVVRIPLKIPQTSLQKSLPEIHLEISPEIFSEILPKTFSKFLKKQNFFRNSYRHCFANFFRDSFRSCLNISFVNFYWNLSWRYSRRNSSTSFACGCLLKFHHRYFQRVFLHKFLKIFFRKF